MSKTVLITGASSGFGAACARLYAQKGYHLLLCARRKERLEALKVDLLPLCSVDTFQVDVRKRSEVEGLFAALSEQQIDIVVNNAGLALGIGPADQANMDDWETMVDTNIKGMMYVAQQSLKVMRQQQNGHLINMGSIAASWPYPGGNTYGATKAFVQQFSRNLRSDMAGTGVRISTIEPGLAETEFSIVRFSGDSDKAAKLYEGTDALSAEDIADIVVWVSEVPKHVNINAVEVMPTSQTWSALQVSKSDQS